MEDPWRRADDRRRWPLRRGELLPSVVAAVGLGSGLGLAVVLDELSVGRLALLVLLAWSLRRGWSRLLGWVALGALHGLVVWVTPERAPETVDLSRPVAATVRRVGAWRSAPDGWTVRVLVLSLRQGAVVDLRRREAWLFLPSEEPPPTSPRLRLKGRLQRSERLRNGLERPPGLWKLSVKSRRLVSELATPSTRRAMAEGVASLRRRIDAVFAPWWRKENSAQNLAGALVLGDPNRLESELAATLRATGLAHLTAVSGLHLSLVSALAMATAMVWGGWGRASLGVAAGALYLLLVGPRASLGRAFLMLSVAFAAALLARPHRSINGLSLAVVAMLLGHPPLVRSLGFQLTVAATAGLLLLAPPLAERLRPLPGPLRLGLSTTLAAQIATLPLTAPVFQLLSPSAPILNLVLVPWTGLVLALVLVALAVSSCGLLLPGSWRLPLPEVLALPYELLVALEPSPALVWPWSGGRLEALALAVLLAAALLVGKRARPVVATAAVVLMLSVGSTGRGAEEVVFLDVGQGDAILLRSGGRVALVDGGGWRYGDFAGRELYPALARAGVRRVDLMIMTHADRDHCGGLLDLTRYLPIDTLWVAPGWDRRSCGRQLVSRLGPRVTVAERGLRRSLGRWRLQVELAGEGRDSDTSGAGSNRGSLVISARWGRRSLLLTGDIDRRVERSLLESETALRSDWLKIAHHGSDSSSSSSFLAVVAPRLAIVSSGRSNPYGHPSPRVLARLRRRSIPLLRTDLDGAVRLRLHSGGYQILTAVPRVRRAVE